MFKAGDKVKVIKAHYNFPVDKVGSIGKVVDAADIYTCIHTCVEFKFTDKNFHSCGHKGKNGHCYWMPNECFKKVAKKAASKATRKPRVLKIGDTVRLIEEYDYSGKELAVDPRTFYKILRIDGSPANANARATGFKYTLPVDGPTEWTPTIEDIVACRKGYHVVDAKHVKIWLSSYDGDLIVCEAKARGEIKSESDKYVAQSIQLTKILCRWDDVSKAFKKEREVIQAHANEAERVSYDEHTKKCEAIWEDAKKKENDLFKELVLGG